MKNKRISYFDLAKGIGIILVVLGHMENIDAGLRTWISSFHMPLFFMISGMLMAAKREQEGNTVDVYIKKAKGILIPYMWFSIIYVPIDIMNLYIHHIDEHTFVQNILDSCTFAGISVMWFLPALFIAEIVAVYIIRKISEVKTKLDSRILTFFAGVLTMAIAYAAWTFIRPYYDAYSYSYILGTLLGFIRVILRGLVMSTHVINGFITFSIIKEVEEKYLSAKGNEQKAILSLKGYSIALGVILLVINMGLCMKNGAVDNHFLTLNNAFLYYICATLGSYAIIFISKGLDSIKPVDYLGRNSLIIMATHLQCYLLYAGILVAIAIDAYVTRAKSYVYMFNSVLFTMFFELIVIVVINKFFPFITGKGSIKDLFKIVKKEQNSVH